MRAGSNLIEARHAPRHSDELKEAIRLWLLEGLSCAQIAAVASKKFGMHLTRNAVIGIIHRNKARLGRAQHAGKLMRPRPGPALGDGPFKKREEKVRRQVANLMAVNVEHRLEVKPYQPPTPVVVTIDAKTYDEASEHLHLEALTSTSCRWPVNDPVRPGAEPHLFCGALTALGRSYCCHHQMRARGAGTKTERSAHRALQKRDLEAAW